MDKQTVQRRTRLTHPPYETIEFSKWTDLNRYLESIAWDWWLFRGQEEAKWPLTSSLTRELEHRCVPREQWRKKEERAIRIFRRKAHLLLQRTPTDLFEWIALMQHHGAPTRLLDFTWSPHVAAFFALDRARGSAAIWGLNTQALPAAERLMQPARRKVVDRHLPPGLRPWNNDDLAVLLLSNRHRTVFCGSPYHMNQRLVVQSGTFVVPGVLHDTVENLVAGLPSGKKALRKLVVHTTALDDGVTLRQAAMRSLYNMNITYESLFPGLDGLARSLNLELEV